MAEHDHLTSPNLGGLDKFASEPERVDKPWGYELIWSKTDHYAGKILFVRAGESLSLQFHNEKDEAWYVLEGRAKLELGGPGERMLNSEVVGPGAAFHFPPGTVHRREGGRGHEDHRGLDAAARRHRAAGRPLRPYRARRL